MILYRLTSLGGGRTDLMRLMGPGNWHFTDTIERGESFFKLGVLDIALHASLFMSNGRSLGSVGRSLGSVVANPIPNYLKLVARPARSPTRHCYAKIDTSQVILFLSG